MLGISFGVTADIVPVVAGQQRQRLRVFGNAKFRLVVTFNVTHSHCADVTFDCSSFIA